MIERRPGLVARIGPGLFTLTVVVLALAIAGFAIAIGVGGARAREKRFATAKRFELRADSIFEAERGLGATVAAAEVTSTERKRWTTRKSFARATITLPLVALVFPARVDELAGRTERAIRRYESALQLELGIGDARAAYSMHSRLGRIYRDQGLPDDAARHFARAYGCARMTGNARRAARPLEHLGLMLCDSGEPDSAIPLLDDAVAIYTRLDLGGDEARARTNLGYAHQLAGDPETALDHYVIVYAACPEFTRPDELMQNLSTVLDELGDDRFVNRCSRFMAETDARKMLRGIWQYEVNVEIESIAPHYRREEDDWAEEALASYYQMAAEYLAVGDTTLAASFLSVIAWTHHSTGANDSALHYHTLALELYEEIGAEANAAGQHEQLAGFHLSTGRNTDGIAHYRAALETYDRLELCDAADRLLWQVQVQRDHVGDGDFRNACVESGLTGPELEAFIARVDTVPEPEFTGG